jgi:hypothetical protein
MKDINLQEDDFEIIEIKRTLSLAMIKIGGRKRFVQRNLIPIKRRREYYEMRKAEDKAQGSQGQY